MTINIVIRLICLYVGFGCLFESMDSYASIQHKDVSGNTNFYWELL